MKLTLPFCLFTSFQIEKNMSAGKWIGGILGFMSGGALGALAGVALGALFDYGLKAVNREEGSSTGGYSGGNDAWNQARQQQYYEGQRNSFLFSLLVLASYIIKADGKVMHSEMEFVRRFLRMNFGEAAVEQGNRILLKLFEEQKRMDASRPGAYKETIRQSCVQIAANMDYSQRLQLLNFLAMIAQADGSVPRGEVDALKEVARYMGLSESEVDSMLKLSGGSLDDAYAVLGVSPDATDDEVRKAYRTLALKHHPDRVAALGDDIRRAAEKKFQEINDAKERIYKARGM